MNGKIARVEIIPNRDIYTTNYPPRIETIKCKAGDGGVVDFVPQKGSLVLYDISRNELLPFNQYTEVAVVKAWPLCVCLDDWAEDNQEVRLLFTGSVLKSKVKIAGEKDLKPGQFLFVHLQELYRAGIYLDEEN